MAELDRKGIEIMINLTFSSGYLSEWNLFRSELAYKFPVLGLIPPKVIQPKHV